MRKQRKTTRANTSQARTKRNLTIKVASRPSSLEVIYQEVLGVQGAHVETTEVGSDLPMESNATSFGKIKAATHQAPELCTQTTCATDALNLVTTSESVLKTRLISHTFSELITTTTTSSIMMLTTFKQWVIPTTDRNAAIEEATEVGATSEADRATSLSTAGTCQRLVSTLHSLILLNIPQALMSKNCTLMWTSDQSSIVYVA